MSGLGSVFEVTVASRDIERQLRFCREAFQLQPVTRDASSVLLGAPGSDRGRLRLVPAAADPGLPSPEVWITGPRLLAVYSKDVPRTQERVTAAGGAPRPYHRFEVEGVGAYTEGLVRGVDDVVWVYPCPARRMPSPAFDSDPERLHGELHYVGITLEEIAPAVEFFAGAGGMAVIMDQEVEADWASDLIGVPLGTRMHVVCLAGEDTAPIRLMLVSYSGALQVVKESTVRTVGIRRISFAADPAEMHDRLVRAGATPLGDGLLRGPAGVEIELRRSAQ
ncbi:MAG: hypothetical protein EPO25_17975 [Gammaproteobacteria bacterium]|nr:MAG: hypothetical protein EPO25_17975 [Gammaproteobacteria bacterium]